MKTKGKPWILNASDSDFHFINMIPFSFRRPYGIIDPTLTFVALWIAGRFGSKLTQNNEILLFFTQKKKIIKDNSTMPSASPDTECEMQHVLE